MFGILLSVKKGTDAFSAKRAENVSVPFLAPLTVAGCFFALAAAASARLNAAALCWE